MQDKNVPDVIDYFMHMLPLVAARSKDPNTKVGAIVVGPDGAIRTTGYNGLVRGIDDDVPERWSRENGEKYYWCEHAERNAIYSGARNGVALLDCTMFTSLMPCVDCARGIVQAGIRQVVVDGETSKARQQQNTTWEKSHERALRTLYEADVELILWPQGTDEDVYI